MGYDTGDPEIPEACSTVFGDQNVSLDRMGIGAYLKLVTHSALTGLILLCTILIECRYSRPQVACASYGGEVSNGLYIRIIGLAYQLQPIDPLIFPGVFSDVSVFQPRGDDAERKQRLRNPEEG